MGIDVGSAGQRAAHVRRRAAFGVVAAVLGLFLGAAAAPSPLYGLYASRWGFSPAVLTVVFAVYVVALVVALLTTGGLSDRLGRRPVVLGALAVQGVAMVAFLRADGVGWLYLARILQGAATGVVTAAASAWLLDVEPRPGRGALVNGAVATGGLALGALGAGALVQYGPDPLRLVYLVLLAGFALLAAVVAVLPEPVADRGRVPLGALRPRVALPRAVRPAFVTVLPCLVATWALGGLYLSLGPSVVLSLQGSSNRLLGGVAVFLLCAAGTAASLLLRRASPRRAVIGGCALLVAGVLVSLGGIAAATTPVFLLGSTVAGAGFGWGFLGAFRMISAATPPDDRGGVIAALYVVNYLAFSVPAVLAGIATTLVGLRATALVYGLVVAALAALALVRTARRPAVEAR